LKFLDVLLSLLVPLIYEKNESFTYFYLFPLWPFLTVQCPCTYLFIAESDKQLCA